MIKVRFLLYLFFKETKRVMVYVYKVSDTTIKEFLENTEGLSGIKFEELKRLMKKKKDIIIRRNVKHSSVLFRIKFNLLNILHLKIFSFYLSLFVPKL